MVSKWDHYCYSLKMRSFDGSPTVTETIDIKLPTGDQLTALTTTGKPDAPLVIVLPAMGVSAQKYRHSLGELTARGLSAAAVDYRGFGASTPRTTRGSTLSYHDVAVVDIPAIVADLRARFPARPVILLGHSLGSQTGLMYAATAPDALDGIALVGAGLPHYRVYPGLSALGPLIAPSACAAIAHLVGYYPGDTLNFLGRQPRPLIKDWARLSRTGEFDAIGRGTNYRTLMQEIHLPILAVTVEGDTMTPPQSLDALLEYVPHADVTRWHCDAAQTNGAAAGHISWIRHGGAIAEQLSHWAAKTVTSTSQ